MMKNKKRASKKSDKPVIQFTIDVSEDAKKWRLHQAEQFINAVKTNKPGKS